MMKSFNDISEQVRRVVALANTIGGKYTANAKHAADVQFFAQIGARARAQHGISVFCTDKDAKYPLIHKRVLHSEVKCEEVSIAPPPKIDKPTITPTEEAHNRMKMDDWLSADAKHRKQLQMMCRHNFIKKMYAELLTDMEVCKMEGWDVLEYPRMIRESLNVCFPKPRQLSLF